MVQFDRAHRDASFAAVSHVTRRGVLEQLGRADASITDLADRFEMALTGMKKHVGCWSRPAGDHREVGRVRNCKLGAPGIVTRMGGDYWNKRLRVEDLEPGAARSRRRQAMPNSNGTECRSRAETHRGY